MNRLTLLAFLSLGGLALQAQPAFSTITISTSPSGARFQVDGITYQQAVTFNWPAGSKHILVFLTNLGANGQPIGNVQTSLDGSTAYELTGWVDNANLIQPSTAAVQTITADPSITSITGKLTLLYRVQLNFFEGPGGNTPPTCGAPGAIPAGQFRPGIVFVGNACYWASANLYVQANSPIVLNAYPYPGFVFLGWSINSGIPTGFLQSLVVNAPVILVPHFSPAKRVTFLTSPLQLQVQIDHTNVPTRGDPGICDDPQPIIPLTGFPPLCFGDFDFAPGSVHVIAGVSPQRDKVGKLWVFDHWSDGLGQNGLYVTGGNVSQPDTVTAFFVPGAPVALLTSPTGLKLNVDGRDNWPSYNFVWAVGSTHQVSASATQTDGTGRKYTFQAWSNGGAPSQTISVDPSTAVNGMRLTANYNKLSRVLVESTPPGISIQVDGAACQTPCPVDRANGVALHITAPATLSAGAGARLDFISWTDGGAADHTFTVNGDYTTVTANYRDSFQLSAASDPAKGVQFQFSPSSSDMFYRQNTQVTITAVPNPGFKFRRWDGDLSGTYPVGVVSMAAPASVIARLDRVPYVAPAGVQNAAAATPNSAVAPGSIISIFGESLAPTLQVGPVNPLAQTISGVSVTVNDRILGLFFVSPTQINAQIPSDLPPGNYTLLIHALGQPDVSGSFTVARNAPGLFVSVVNSQHYSVAFHADGSVVRPESPAKSGETVSILGTGFGPYATPVIDGFFPQTPPPALADAVSLSVGGHPMTPTWTGAAAGYTGITLTKFQVPAGLAAGTNIPVYVSVNGVHSNTVMLPLE